MMKEKKTTVRCWLAILAGLTVFSTAQAEAQSLKEAVDTALTSYPEVKALEYGAMAARSVQAQSYAGYLPTLDLLASTGYEISDNPATRSRVGGDDDLHPSELQLSLNLNLFEGYATQSRVHSSSNYAKIASLRVKEAAERLALQTAQVYLAVLQYEELVTLASNNIAAHQSLLDLVRQRVTQQVGSKSDESQVLSRLKAAQAALQHYEGSLTDARSAYKTKINAAPENLSAPTQPAKLIASNLAEDTRVALESNPMMEQARANIAMAEAEQRMRQSAYYPRLDLELNAAHDRNQSGTPGLSESVSALVILSQNLYAGGRDYYAVQEAFYLIKQAESELQKAERELREHVEVVYSGWQVAKGRKETFETQVEDNVKVKEAFFQQFTVNKRSLLDLLDSENALYSSRVNHTQESFTEMLAAYQLLAAQGKLLEGLKVEMPKGTKFREMALADTVPYYRN